jgi:hypothetical protein
MLLAAVPPIADGRISIAAAGATYDAGVGTGILRRRHWPLREQERGGAQVQDIHVASASI